MTTASLRAIVFQYSGNTYMEGGEQQQILDATAIDAIMTRIRSGGFP